MVLLTRLLTLLLLSAACLATTTTVANAAGPTRIRGEPRQTTMIFGRALKQEDKSSFDNSSPTTASVVSNAIGDEPEGFADPEDEAEYEDEEEKEDEELGELDEDAEEEEEEEEEDQDITAGNDNEQPQDEEQEVVEMVEDEEEPEVELEYEPEEDEAKNDKNNDNDDEEEEDDEFSFSFVKLPELILELGVVIPTASTYSNDADAVTSRQGGGKRDTPDSPVEAVMESYFEELYSASKNIMGANYIASDLDAKMEKSQNYGTTGGGGGSLLDIVIKGKAQYYQGEEPVPSKKELETILTDFFAVWSSHDLEIYLEENGIGGAAVMNFTLKGTPLQEQGFADSSSESANAALSNEDGNDKPVALITGLTLFSVCLCAAFVLLFYIRKQLFTECGSCCESLQAKVRGDNLAWHGMREDDQDGGDDLKKEVKKSRAASKADKDDSRSWWQWSNVFARRRMENEKTSDVLRRIKVVVDRSQMLTTSDDSTGYNNYTTSSHTTLPVSPAQRTLREMTAENDFEGGYYRGDPGWTPTTYNSSSPHTQGTDRSTPLKTQDDEGESLSDWAAYLNPCMLPNVHFFQKESENLDDIVASLPRNKSIFDGDTTASSTGEGNQTASPPRPTFARTSDKYYARDDDSSSIYY